MILKYGFVLVVLFAALASGTSDETFCDCEANDKPTHMVDIIEAAANILLVEVLVTDPAPRLRPGNSGPGLRMEYKAKVVKVIKGCLGGKSTTIDIKQLVFNECPPPTLQGQYYISGAMGSKKKKRVKGGPGGREGLFYLDPCGIAIPEDTPLREALDNLGNTCQECGQSCAPCLTNGVVSPLQQCDDVCSASTCAEDNAKCLVSKCGQLCQATWIGNGTNPKILCPSGLPSGAIAEGIENLQKREKLLVQAREAFKLGKKIEGYKKIAEVAKLSSGGEEFRVPPTTTTTVPPETIDPEATRGPIGLQGLLTLAKEIPAVGHTLDSFRRLAAKRLGRKFVPKFDNKSRRARRARRLARRKRRRRRRRGRRRRRRGGKKGARRRRRRRRRRGGKGKKGKNSRRRRRRGKKGRGAKRGAKKGGRKGRTSRGRKGRGRSKAFRKKGRTPRPPNRKRKTRKF